jgi:hypothetical protein
MRNNAGINPPSTLKLVLYHILPISHPGFQIHSGFNGVGRSLKSEGWSPPTQPLGKSNFLRVKLLSKYSKKKTSVVVCEISDL